MPSSILITGGAGYIGSMLANKLLYEGYKVQVLDSLIFGGDSLLHFYGHPNFKFVKEDIRNIENIPNILDNVDVVVHLAAIVGEHLCRKIPDIAYEINQTATKKLLAVCKDKQVKRFIFSSTCSNYGVVGDQTYADENSPLNPISLYSKTKVESENYILDSTNQDLCSTVLRFATVYGLSQRMRFDLLLHELLIDAITKNKISLYGSSSWRPLIHIQDVVDAIFLVLKSPEDKIKKTVFNVGNSRENYTKLELAKLIKQVSPTTKIFVEDDKKDLRSYKVSFDKINRELGYNTKKTVKDGINEIFQAIKQKIIQPEDPRYSNASFTKKMLSVNE